MGESDFFALRYTGDAVSDGMDPLVFAKSVEGFANYIASASSLTLGKQSEIEFKIRRVKEGSLSLEFILRLVDYKDLIIETAAVVGTVMDLAKQGIELTKHLNGMMPVESKSIGGGKVNIENNLGEVNVFTVEAGNLIINMSGSKEAEKFARLPMIKEADGLVIEGKGFKSMEISKDDSKKILSIASNEAILENTYTTHLTVVKPVLEGQGKWTLSDGARNFMAEISDKNF